MCARAFCFIFILNVRRQAIEALLTEMHAVEHQSSIGRALSTGDVPSIFSEHGNWQSLDQPVPDEGLSISVRDCRARFASSSSPLLVECIPHFLNLSKHCPSQGSLVLTVYALGNHETIPCLERNYMHLDMLSPNYPINILVADGDLTCACFAAEQLFSLRLDHGKEMCLPGICGKLDPRDHCR